MSEPYAILAIPVEGDPGGLLADGPCGGTAPWLAYDAPSGTWRNDWIFPPLRGRALPLVWDGVPVADGVFRAWQAWGPDEDPEFEATGWSTYDVLAEALDSAAGAEWLARAIERLGKAKRVVVLVGGPHE